ncbi:copper uptake system-associated protein [Methylocystis hirsuta]|uniref:Copper uptake system-associated protein n=1 Tax=Methylocystis hirsuta TaxID=369798 RepID=A0A3M9XTB5_9HYPH|nr:copper uptake system-associated protein [Methylocystis hirsuta]RNJ51022.1 copper uptake system-associated protein [Methylocystis hirsuta]
MRLFLIGMISAAACLSARADEGSEAVRRLLFETFDKPETRLFVDAVVVEGDSAVADWRQGELGGRAFLTRKDDAWTIALCAGDALKDSATLEKLGVSKANAEALARRLAAAETQLFPDVVERFSRFDGMAAVEADGSHSPLDPHHKPIP